MPRKGSLVWLSMCIPENNEGSYFKYMNKHARVQIYMAKFKNLSVHHLPHESPNDIYHH